MVVSIPEAHAVPAKGNGEIKAFLVPNPFQEDTWVRSIEVRPGNASVVHHVMVQVPEDMPAPSFSWGAAAAPVLLRLHHSCSRISMRPCLSQSRIGSTALPDAAREPTQELRNPGSCLCPRRAPMDFGSYDSAKLIPGGGNLRIEVHYTPNGTATSDQTRIGFTLAKQPPQRRYRNTCTEIPCQRRDANTCRRIELGNSRRIGIPRMPNWYGLCRTCICAVRT